jgi:hypothetical protein
MMVRRPRAALFLARAWYENGEFRARVSYSTDISSETPHTEIVTANPAELWHHLAAWLEGTSDLGNRNEADGESTAVD